MVCLGNICRSPLAEGVMRHYTEQHNLPWQIDSAGTGSWHIGNPPDIRSVQTAQKHGIDISNQRARKFKLADFEDFDVIFVMDKSNRHNLLEIAPSDKAKAKVQLLLEKGRVEYPNFEVPDPYYDGRFDEVFGLIDAACQHIVAMPLIAE